MLREASWSRSNSSWGISQFKRPNDILAASSGFDQRSMTISVSSRILEIAEGLPTTRSEYARRERHFSIQLVLPRTVRRRCLGCQECQSKSKTGNASSASACDLYAFLVTVQ